MKPGEIWISKRKTGNFFVNDVYIEIINITRTEKDNTDWVIFKMLHFTGNTDLNWWEDDLSYIIMRDSGKYTTLYLNKFLSLFEKQRN